MSALPGETVTDDASAPPGTTPARGEEPARTEMVPAGGRESPNATEADDGAPGAAAGGVSGAPETVQDAPQASAMQAEVVPAPEVPREVVPAPEEPREAVPTPEDAQELVEAPGPTGGVPAPQVDVVPEPSPEPTPPPEGAERGGAPAATESAPRWRWAYAAALLGVVALSIAPFIADAKSEGRVPGDADLAAAVQAVRADFRDGDAVRVEPSWWTLPYRGLQDMGEGTAAWPFPALLLSEELDPVEALGATRLFMVSGFGREPALPENIASAGRGSTELFRSETVAVARWELDRAKRLKTLSAQWDQAKVARSWGPGQAYTPCRVSGGKHRCGRDSWLDVALEERVVWRREVNWLFVHPGPAGTALRLTWPELPRASEGGPTWLFVRVGPSLEAVRHPDGKDVEVAVAVDGLEVDRFALAPRRFWMERRAVRLPAGEGPATVEITITTEDNAWRETMLEADVLATLPEALRAWATNVVER